MSDVSDLSSDSDAGRYVAAPNKKRKCKKTINILSEMDRLVSEKVSAILRQRNDLSQNTSLQKYTEKADLVPLFDPENFEGTALNWLHKIEQIGMINNWSDETKSFCMQSRLTGLAKVWYNGLVNYALTWTE